MVGSASLGDSNCSQNATYKLSQASPVWERDQLEEDGGGEGGVGGAPPAPVEVVHQAAQRRTGAHRNGHPAIVHLYSNNKQNNGVAGGIGDPDPECF